MESGKPYVLYRPRLRGVVLLQGTLLVGTSILSVQLASCAVRVVGRADGAYDTPSEVEDEGGRRCPEPRSPSGRYCSGHRCAWISADRVPCERSSYGNHQGTCSFHICVVEGCAKRAENNSNRCEDHLCAYCFINPENGAKGEFPYCYHPPVRPGPYCQVHQEYMDAWASMVKFEPWRFGYA